ncbi:MAG: hypothetical protein OEZ16_07980 [Chromatiales bacterium]|nr:hypothetical protein [Chromatiales bacterium]
MYGVIVQTAALIVCGGLWRTSLSIDAVRVVVTLSTALSIITLPLWFGWLGAYSV